MPKILDYNTLTTTAGCNVLFIGDKNSSITNPEIKNITVENLFKRETFYALNANGITFYDDGSNVSLFIKDGGNIGIGGTTANYALQVNGTFHVTGGIYDTGGSAGTTGKFLKVTGTDTYAWTNITTSDIGGGGLLSGGVANYIPKWSDSTTLTNSVIYESSSKIGIGLITPGATFHVVSVLSGSDAIVQNSTSGSVIELRRDSGSSTTNSLYISNTSSGGFSLGNANTGGASNINFNASGQLGVKTTTFNAALNVSETNSGVIGDLYTNSCSGSWIYFKNTQSTAYSNVLSYSNYESSTQRVNWITGTFEDGSSNQYFGIHHKTAQLNTTNAVFDSSTVCNNLFYINTGGCASLAHNIHTHNKTNTGHNTGRFIHVVSLPIVYEEGLISQCFVLPPMGVNPNWYRTNFKSMEVDDTGGSPVYSISCTFPKPTEYGSKCVVYAYNHMPYDGIISSITGYVMNDGSTINNSAGINVSLNIFKDLEDTSDSGNICGTFSQSITSPASIPYGTAMNLNLTGFTGSCAFSVGDKMLFSYVQSCGCFIGNLNIKYEFKIT